MLDHSTAECQARQVHRPRKCHTGL